MFTPTVSADPTLWSRAPGHDQGQLHTTPAAILTVAGQGSLDERGQMLHDGDPAAQLALALANVIAVVERAGMTLRDIAQLRVYTTDIDTTLAVYDTITERLAEAGAYPPATLVEVSRLARPGMTVEIEALAIRCVAVAPITRSAAHAAADSTANQGDPR